jgi:PAS domain S-box-containing protein
MVDVATEAAQRERETRLILDTIPGLAAILTPAGEVAVVNHELVEYCGQPLEAMKQWGSNGTVHPDDLPHVGQVFTQSIASGDPYDFEARIRRFDGVYRWCQVRGLPLRDANGIIARWYVLLIDIDERKRAEVELRRAYDSFADAQRLSKTGSFITDLVGDDHNWSEETYRIFGFEPGTKVSLQRIQAVIHPDDQSSFGAMIARAMSGANVDFSFRIVTAHAGLTYVRGIAHVVEKVENRPMFVGALQDVTENTVAEMALDRARSELAHVARVTTVSALTASIAHEVNQPLSGIITNAGTCLRMLAADPPDVDGARETARRTLRDGNRAADVIARLRALFSKREFTLEPLDMSEVTQEVVALSLSDLQRNRIVLESEFADALPLITGDRVQLQQVVLNLLRNASDAMVTVHDRPRQLLIRTTRAPDDRVLVTVRDAGIGLDAQSMTKLFDAFYTTKPDGMGIGLSVSRSIIERHHGRLWAEPNTGPGSTFSFSIPAAATDTKVQ